MSSHGNLANAKIKQTPSEEKVLRDRGYKLSIKLGEGGYAKVYLGDFQAPHSDKPIHLACKVINTLKAPKRFLTKFLPRELKILVKVDHPHIIQIHSIFQRKSKYYIFMRHAEKGDLLDYIINTGAVKQGQARVWTRQMALAIQYLHALEIAHRDLKCENILLTSHNNIKVSDFGFSRSVLNDDRRRELSETYCGSVSYAPPQILQGEPYNPKQADMWSLGVMIFTMLNKTNPFDSKNLKLLLENQLAKKYKFRARFAHSFSDEVKSLIAALLEPDESRRLRIEQVINSDWIAMDPSLKSLNSVEFSALSSAMEEAKSSGLSSEHHEGQQREKTFSQAMKKVNLNRNSLTIFKEYDGGYDLQLIRSEVQKVDGE